VAEQVAVATASSAFEARVLQARLASEGIRCELRGGLDGPYPVGPVQVLVPADDAPAVRELLLVDQVEAVFEEPAWDGAGRAGPALDRPWLLGAAALLLVALVAGRVVQLLL
jgi:hypothetical protein